MTSGAPEPPELEPLLPLELEVAALEPLELLLDEPHAASANTATRAARAVASFPDRPGWSCLLTSPSFRSPTPTRGRTKALLALRGPPSYQRTRVMENDR